MIKNIFFDLDGTLLPMEQEAFMKAYFTELCNRVCPVLHIQPEILIKGVWKGTEAMVKNDGSRTNLQVFWESCAKICGKDILTHISEFDDFYNKEFLAITERHMDMTIPFARAEDQANVILFLASDQSRYVNGEELKCDGGWTCF